MFSIGLKHFTGTAIGIARGAIELIEDDMRSRVTVTGIDATIERRLTWRRNDAFAGQLAVSAVERLYSLTDGRGLSLTSPYQRAWRDVHAAVQQMLMSWDMHATNYGKARMGLPFSDPRL